MGLPRPPAAQLNLRHRGTEKGREIPPVPRDPLTEKIISAAIELHRELGPGQLESNYEKAHCPELRLRGVPSAQQVEYPVVYKGEAIGEHYIDLLVEIKAVER